MRYALLFTLLLALAGCRDGHSRPIGDDVVSENLGKYYNVAVTPETVKVGERVNVVIALTPGSGYKWNDEYPAKFTLTAEGALELGKARFSARKKELEISTSAARATVPLTVTSVGPQTIRAKGNFSVCDKTSCKIMRNESFSVAVAGQ